MLTVQVVLISVMVMFVRVMLMVVLRLIILRSLSRIVVLLVLTYVKGGVMLERDIDRHAGCPYRHSCRKDESKCCYLVGTRCMLNDDELEDFL